MSPPSNYFRFKTIRDPLYGFIDLSKLETKIIDSEIFRRLQFIKQLSHAYLSYPSAIHTRFEHSLGTVYVSDIMAKELNFDKPDEIEKIRLSCLLHDIGHGPFSHLFENIIIKINPGISEPHEKISKIMLNEDSELDSILGSKKDDIIELLGNEIDSHKEPTKSLQSAIISSGLDADKIDYLRRDSYHIGVVYGQFDFNRILHTLITTPKRSGICIGNKGKDALENYRLARYLMHVQVYGHHARLAADQMFLQSLEIAIHEEKIIDENLLKFDPNKDNSDFLNFYKSLDDFSIYSKIINDPDAKTSKSILNNIKQRKLLKRICEFTPNNLESTAHVEYELMKMKPDDYKKVANEITTSLNLNSHDVIFYKSEIKNKLFKKGEIMFCNGDEVFSLNSVSPISGKDVDKYFVFGPADAEIRKKIRTKISDRFNIDIAKLVPSNN